MSERKALLLTLIAGLAVFLGAFFLLESLNANSDLLVLVYVLTLGATAYASSSVVMHYGAKRRR